MKWTLPFPMFAADQLVPLAKVAEDAGYDSIAMPDSVFFPEEVSAGYPYSPDGSRFWAADEPFVDPFIGVSAMAAVTERINFYTNVVKLPIRHPLLVAKQISSMAVLSNNRFALGVGLSWIPEEFEWLHTEKKTRGARANEAIEILKLVCAGNGPEWVEYHGEHYDFDRLMISPAPDKPVPIYVGGLSEPGFKRAAKLGDGWVSVQNSEDDIVHACKRLTELRAEYGRENEPFEIKALCVDAFDMDGYKRLAEAGVTELQVVPWFLYGGDPNSFDTRRDAFNRFAEDIIVKFDD